MWNCTVTSYLEENRPAHADSQCEQVIYVTEVHSTLLIFMWKIMHGICMLVLRLWGFCHLSGGLTSLPVLSGPEDTVSPEEDGPVLGHLGLCQTCLPEGGCDCFLQGLHPQHAGHHPLCWHRLGCLWGMWLLSLSRDDFSFCYCFYFILTFLISFALLSSVRRWRIPGCSASPQTALIRECLCSWLVALPPAHVASCPATHSPWSGLECRHKVSHCRTLLHRLAAACQKDTKIWLWVTQTGSQPVY